MTPLLADSGLSDLLVAFLNFVTMFLIWWRTGRIEKKTDVQTAILDNQQLRNGGPTSVVMTEETSTKLPKV